MWGCEDEMMWRCADVKMRKCEDVRMWRWEDVKMNRCRDEKMWRCEDVRMKRCEEVRMWRWEDAKMSRCKDEQMLKLENVNMKMFDRPPLLEEHFAQTLSGITWMKNGEETRHRRSPIFEKRVACTLHFQLSIHFRVLSADTEEISHDSDLSGAEKIGCNSA